MIFNTLIGYILMLFSFQSATVQEETVRVSSFNEVIISPHIQVVFKQTDEESVIIENSKVEREKINIEVNGKTLRIYLEDAKTITKTEKVSVNGNEEKRPIYKGTMLTVIVNYKSLQNLSIRGDEVIKCESPISQKNFEMEIYGESKVYLGKLELEALNIDMYGESYLEISSGNVVFQKYRCYGESEVSATNLQSRDTKITAYGDNHLVVNASNELKVTAFGESRIQYKGNAEVKSGLKIGKTTITKIQ